MSTISQAESRRLYSWWWASHISPKNSKWLQEDLTDMDSRVKSMIKLIEEDADSFAKRAEMYYKKRPELMKLVEEFYRAYRALAERYDHATRALRQAHRTMAETFPDQISFAAADDSPSASSPAESEPCTPEMPSFMHVMFSPDDLHKEASNLSPQFMTSKRSGTYAGEPEIFAGKKGLKQVHEMFGSPDGATNSKYSEGRARKGLNFREENVKSSESKLHVELGSSGKHGSKEDALEKERTLLDEISQLSSEIETLRKQVNTEAENASYCKAEAERLQEINLKLGSDKDNTAVFYQQALKKISDFEAEINNFRNLKLELLKKDQELNISVEKYLVLDSENQVLRSEIDELKREVSDLSEGLQLKQEDYKKLEFSLREKNMHLMQAEAAVGSLKELHSQSQKELEMCKLEKEIAVEKLKHVEVKLQSLEEELCHDEKAFEQNEMELEELKVAIEDAQLQSVQAEVDIQTFKELYIQTIDELKVTSLEMQRGAQMLKNTELKKQALEEDAFQIKTENAKLSRKLKEMRDEMDDMKLSVKVEHARTLQVEKALECLKESYAQSQEELRLLSLDRENGVQMLRNMELRNQNLEEEILGVKEENNYLSTEMVQKRKELEELKIILQDEQSRSAQVEVSYETMKEKYAQAQEELGSLLSEWQKEAQMLKSDQLKQETFEKEIQQLREENHNKCHELELTKEESKKLKIFLENVQLQSVQTEVDLEIMKKLQTESQEKLIVLLEERDKEAQVLKSIEFQKSILEEKVQKLKTDNDNQRLDIEQNQEELHKLKLFIKDEQLRSVQTEATLDSLKKLYAESQEELRFSLKERENEVQILKNIKEQRQTLEKEIQQVKEKNDSQSRELEEKQKELEKLKSFLQEDHLQLQKTEADLESFKELLHDSREELKLLLEEKQNEGHIQQSVELQKHALEEEIQQLNDEKANQSKELEQNQQELNKLKLCLEAEKLQEMQTEAALESLKKLYTESQDELKLSSQERQNVIQMLKDVELKKQVMGEEFQLVVQEKIDLNEKLVRMRKELKELNIVIENERLGVMQAEIALAYIRDLYYRSQDVLCIASLGRQKEIQILEEKNQALKENIQQNEEENCKLKGELHQNQRKLEKLKASIEIEQLRSADIEGALNSLERLYADTQEELKVVSLERQNQVQLLASLELKNKSRDEENCKLISELNKQFQQLEELHIFLKEEKLHSEQVHAEFDHLKKLYNQSREELNIASMEIKHNIQMLRDVEFQKQALEKEMLLVKEENGNMKQGLHDKQEEIERLHISIQDEHLHSLQEEVALKSLKELYFQSQNELKILTLNVKKKDQLLEELGLRKQYLEDEVTRVEKEMQDLSKRNIVSLSIIKNLQGETIIFKEKNIKLENELQLHKNEKKALQLEICCLQEQLNDLEQKHKCITGQLEATGLDANSLQSSVETLRNENSMLKSTCEKQENEKVLFLGKLADMHMLSERNATLANSLSDAMFELEGLREKLHTSENSCVILQESNAVLISENSSLISKICSIMENTEEIVEKNVFFENSLYVASLELEEMRGKLRCFEEICRVICDEKANLQRENNTLLSQVECFDNSLKILEEKYAELHEKCSFLEGEKDLAQKMVCELQILLDTEKANKENTLHSNRDKLACLDHQIDLLNEEVQHKEEVITNKENELLALLFEIFIFQRCLHDLHDINLVVSGDCHQLGQEVQKQQKIVGSLSEQIKKLKKRILSMWMSLNPEMGCFVDADYELLCQSIQDKVIELQDYCSELEDEKHRQLLDKMVILMLLHHQIGLDVVDLKLERSSLDQHCRIMDSELLLLHGEKRDILEMNGQIRHELEESYQREEILKAEMEILCRLLTNLRMDYDISENTNRKLIEKNQILSAKFEHVMKERARLDKDLSHALEEVAVLDCLSLIFKQSSEEWANNLVFTNKELNSLHKSNDGQEQNLKETAVMLHIFEAENLKLYEGLISRLHEYNGQLTILKKNVSIVGDSSKLLNNQVDELKLQIEDRNVLLSQKKLEASEAYMKVHAMQDENAEIQSSLLGARKELDMTNAVRGQLEDKVSALSENFRKGTEELYAVLEDNRHLHADLLKLQNENRKLRTKEQLASRLSKELEYCEAEFIVLANDSQLAGILALLFEEKVFELWKLLKSIEIRSIVEKNALIEELTRRHTHINMLKKNIINLEEENSLLKVEQDNWHPVISSLWRSILNLENYGHKTGKLRGFHNHVIMDDHILTHENENCMKLSASKANMEFQNLVSKLEALLNNLMESESHLVQTRSNLNSRSENCMHDTGPSASESRVGTGRRANAKSHDHIQPKEDCRLQKESGKEVNKRDELISKDIQLDHISHSTQTEASADTCGCGAMVFVESEDQMLELWETAEMDCKGQALNVPAMAAGNNLESRFSEPEEEEKSEYTSSEIIVEKELGVDKLEIPDNERNSSSHDDQKNVLERLSSDAKRLIALQTSALELKRKLQMFENANHPKDIEYFNVKEQLKRAEDSMTLLVDVNEKLMRKARRHSHANGDSNVHDTEDMLKQRRLVSERAWRVTQKIRKLELDLQKIQYVMHKLEEETERRRTATVDKKTRVLLSDYLFGKKDGRRKRRHFCGCVRTKDDCYV